MSDILLFDTNAKTVTKVADGEIKFSAYENQNAITDSNEIIAFVQTKESTPALISYKLGER